VQRALSEEQVQKIEAGVAEAEQARQDELDERRLKARQEREEAERQAERARNIAAEQARQEEAEQKRVKLRQQREEAERQAEQEAAAKRAQRETAETAAAAQTSVLRVAQAGINHMQRAGAEIQGVTNSYIDAIKTLVPDLQTVAALPKAAVSAMTDIGSAWIDLMGQTTQMSQDLLQQSAEQQQRFAANVVRSWVEHNARVMQITMRAAQEGFQFVDRSSARFEDHGSGRQ
jgi:hypothetical protein